jgi:hypothetical protein
MGLDVGNWVRGWTGQRGRELDYQTQMQDVRNLVATTPIYTPPEEVAQLQQLYSQQATDLRSTGQEITDIASARAGQSLYGGGAVREDIRRSTAAGVQDLQTVAGSSASFLGGISQLGQSNIQSQRNIAMQNAQFRDQAQRDYLQSLRERAGLEAQATGMETTGLQVGISEADKVYQSELERMRAMQQLEITLAGNELARS